MNQEYETPFLYRNRIHHKALDRVHGDKIYVSGSSGFEIANWMGKRLGLEGKNDSLSEGYNVLNFAVSLAYDMGCYPIIMVGVDLAYSQGLSYSSGINSHPLYDRRNSFRTKSDEEVILDKKDIYGQPIRTLWKWVREALWYGLFTLEHSDVLLINATEGGIGFPDIQNKSLTEVAAQYLVKHYDIPTWLHGEIQNTHWPHEVNETKITSLLKQLSESLKRCVEKYKCIENELAVIPQYIPNDNISDRILKIVDELKNEEAFQALLRNIEESSFHFTSLERQRLEDPQKNISLDENALRKNTLDLAHYGLLRKTAYSNALLIDEILNTKKDLNLKTALPQVKSLPSDEEIYVFDEQYLTLRDRELDLNYSESFPTDSYLRKETIFYPEGTLKFEQFYQGMLLHGPSTFFSKNGKVLARAWFIHGQQQGKMRAYFSSGQLHSILCFRDGQKHGKQEYFYRSGALKTVLYFKFSLLHSETAPACTLYHANGQMARRQYYINGQREGLEQIWNESGQLEIEAEYLRNHPIGAARQWHSNGQIAREIIYNGNSEKISAHYWNSEGKPISEGEPEEESYFEALSKKAGNLTQSLEDVLLKVSTLTPNIESLNVPEKGNTQPDFSEDLKDLQDEMNRLQELSQALDRESAVENAQECGLDPSNRLSFEQQLMHKHRKMTDQMQSIDEGLKDMLKNLLESQKDDENER
ncbi:MAG: DUF115 domain-containing protein [Parachlamydiaceae bacterium]|nr:DUF115 domain-containing protein [Parachlamydiaceae bacterium]